MNRDNIKPVLDDYYSSSLNKSEFNKKWELHVGGLDATRNSVRHELYHYFRDVPKEGEKKKKILTRIFNRIVSEPRATLYGTFKIKL